MRSMSDYRNLARFYDLDQGHISLEEIFFFHNLSKEYGTQVLELGCGTGRLTIPLANKGMKITAVDNVIEMLEIGQKKFLQSSGKATGTIQWMIADATSLSIPQQFDIVVAVNNLLLEIEPGALRNSVLNSICSHLRKTGCAVIEVLNPATARLDLLNGWTRTIGNYQLGQEIIIVNATTVVDFNVIQVNLTYHVTDLQESSHKTYNAHVTQHYLDFDEIHALVNMYGLTCDKIYGDYDMSVFNPNSSPRILLVVRRVD